MGVTLLVVQDGPKQYELRGRMAVMVRWLVSRSQRLMASDKVAVTFDCAGRKVSAEIKERELVDDPPAFG